MPHETKPTVELSESFDRLDIRLGKVLAVEIASSTPKIAYKLTIDFGKYGSKTSIGRFTKHSPEELLGVLVIGVLNFPPRKIGDEVSEVLILGVQYPKADSGEATPITPLNGKAKLGSKLF